MKCPKCGGNATVIHTEISDSAIKRRRLCTKGHKITTYERCEDALTLREKKLVDTYRKFTPEQRNLLWANTRLLKQMNKK